MLIIPSLQKESRKALQIKTEQEAMHLVIYEMRKLLCHIQTMSLSNQECRWAIFDNAT